MEEIVGFVCRQVIPIEIEIGITINPEAFEAAIRKAILKVMKKGLKDDGMGNIGKTTMVNHVAAQSRESRNFDFVMTGVVSQSPDLTKIQVTLAGPSGCCTGKPKLIITNWEKVCHLGSGYFGSVYEVFAEDIKCANILVHANGSVKLADFGLAKAIKMNEKLSCQGTANWMAPEVVNHESQGYGLLADIWSLGCTVLEMLTGMVPYSDLEWMAALWKIGNGKLPLVPDSLSREAQDFIRLCLQVEPDNRPTAAQLLEHPFVNKPLPPTSSGLVSPYNHHRQS